jgi:hypothetical protein
LVGDPQLVELVSDQPARLEFLELELRMLVDLAPHRFEPVGGFWVVGGGEKLRGDAGWVARIIMGAPKRGGSRAGACFGGGGGGGGEEERKEQEEEAGEQWSHESKEETKLFKKKKKKKKKKK